MSILFPGRYSTLYGLRFLQTDPAPAPTSPAAEPAKPADPAKPTTPEYKPPASQDELDALIGKEKAKAERAAKKAAEADIETAKAAAIEEYKTTIANEQAEKQGEFKTLYENANKEIERLKGENATLKSEKDAIALSATKSAIAAKYGLPTALADRLQGDTEAALEDDAKALAAVAKVDGAPNTEAGKGKSGGPGNTSPTPPVKTGTHKFGNRNIVPFAGSEAHAKEA